MATAVILNLEGAKRQYGLTTGRKIKQKQTAVVEYFLGLGEFYIDISDKYEGVNEERADYYLEKARKEISEANRVAKMSKEQFVAYFMRRAEIEAARGRN